MSVYPGVCTGFDKVLQGRVKYIQEWGCIQAAMVKDSSRNCFWIRGKFKLIPFPFRLLTHSYLCSKKYSFQAPLNKWVALVLLDSLHFFYHFFPLKRHSLKKQGSFSGSL